MRNLAQLLPDPLSPPKAKAKHRQHLTTPMVPLLEIAQGWRALPFTVSVSPGGGDLLFALPKHRHPGASQKEDPHEKRWLFPLLALPTFFWGAPHGSSARAPPFVGLARRGPSRPLGKLGGFCLGRVRTLSWGPLLQGPPAPARCACGASTSSTLTLTMSPGFTTSRGFDEGLGHRRDVHQAVLVHADVDEGAERGDVGDHALPAPCRARGPSIFSTPSLNVAAVLNAGRGSRPGFSSSRRMSVTVGRPNVSSTKLLRRQRAASSALPISALMSLRSPRMRRTTG